MNSSIGDEVKKIYGKELSAKPESPAKRKTKRLIRDAGVTLFAVLLVASLIVIAIFDKLIIMQQEVYAQGSRTECEYQRRTDLVPRLITYTLEYAGHERALFKFVSDARDLKMALERIAGATGDDRVVQVDKSLSKLMAIAEQYPDLKATQGYQDLMRKIEATEDRISQERGKYSKRVNEFNMVIMKFPMNVFAHFFGMDLFPPYHPEVEPMPVRCTRLFFANAPSQAE